MNAHDVDDPQQVVTTRPLRVGWLVEPGFGPISPEVAATVHAAAEALKSLGCLVEPVRAGEPVRVDLE